MLSRLVMLLSLIVAALLSLSSVDARRVLPNNRQGEEPPTTRVMGVGAAAGNEEQHEGRNQSRYLATPETLVTGLPGLAAEEAARLVQHAGYLQLPGNGGALFYWMFENPEPDAPLIIWLNGGPGCSSMDGLFLELGPLRLVAGAAGGSSAADTLKINPHSWHNAGHLVFIDQPVGTGLSFSRGKYASNDREINAMLYDALMELLRLHPKLAGSSGGAGAGPASSRRLFLTGESHAGHYIPSFASYLLKKNEEAGVRVKIALAGIAIGNGWTDPYNQYDVSDFVYGMGIISSSQREELKAREKVCHSTLSRGVMASKACFSLLDDALDASGYDRLSRASMYDIRLFEHSSSYPPGHDIVERYLNRADVRKALHVGSQTLRYVECADPPYNALSHQDGLGVIPDLVQVLHSQVPVLLFSGQYDVICNHIGTEKMLEKMDWNGNKGWRSAKSSLWSADGKSPSGYIKSYQNLQFLLVLDSGHMVPLSKPKESLDMIRRFVQGKSFADLPSKVGPKIPISSMGIGSAPSVTLNCSNIAEIVGVSVVNKVTAAVSYSSPKLLIPPVPLDASVALFLDAAQAPAASAGSSSGGGGGVLVRIKLSPSGAVYDANTSAIFIRGLENGKSISTELQYIVDGKSTGAATNVLVTPGCHNPGKVQCCGAGTCVYSSTDGRGQCVCDTGRYGTNCEGKNAGGGVSHCPSLVHPRLDRSTAFDVAAATVVKSNCVHGNCGVRIKTTLHIPSDFGFSSSSNPDVYNSVELLLETELSSILKSDVPDAEIAVRFQRGSVIGESEYIDADILIFAHSAEPVDIAISRLNMYLHSENSPLRFGMITRFLSSDFSVVLDATLAHTGIQKKKQSSTINVEVNAGSDAGLGWGHALLIVVAAMSIIEAGRRVYARFAPEQRPVTRISLVPI